MASNKDPLDDMKFIDEIHYRALLSMAQDCAEMLNGYERLKEDTHEPQMLTANGFALLSTFANLRTSASLCVIAGVLAGGAEDGKALVEFARVLAGGGEG